MQYYVRHTAAAAAVLCWACAVEAQSFDAVGTRAAGMGGAFVAVSDDASAAYWNPAGFASGSFFSAVADRTTSKPRDGAAAGQESGFLFALGMPALGLSYYRIQSSVAFPVRPGAAGLKAGTGMAGLKAGSTDLADVKASAAVSAGLKPRAIRSDETVEFRIGTLVTHHAGATVIQSIGRGLAAGATVKAVRGGESGGPTSTKFDTDVGLMAAGPLVRAGLTIRNVTRPGFTGADGSRFELPRQARAGVAIAPVEGWVIDTDFDLTTTRGPQGDRREVAAGTEGRLGRKTLVRGGLRLNTKGDSDTAVSAGGSYMAFGSVFLDAQITGGASRANRGWGISARFVY